MLTDTAVRQAKPADRPRKLSDQGGLYLFVGPSGTKSWRFDFRFLKRGQTLVIGPYPEVTLRLARKRHADARRLLEAGENPAAKKQRDKEARRTAGENTFKAVAEGWFKELALHRSKSWNLAIRGWLDNYIYPDFGGRPLEAIDPRDVLALVRRIADDGKARTAENVRWLVSRVYSHSIRNLKTRYNPAKELRGAIAVPPPTHHKPLSAKDLPQFVQNIRKYDGRAETRLALQLLALTFVRKTELLAAPWSEIDLEEKTWRIDGTRMKMREPHIVPLSRQAVACFKDLKSLSQGSRFVFPHFGDPRRHMSGFTMNVAFQTMGYGDKFTPHGVRSTASTTLNEMGYRADVIERQLAHAERSRVRAAYNQADYLEERRKMMQQWADHLDDAAESGKVVPIGSRKARKGRKHG